MNTILSKYNKHRESNFCFQVLTIDQDIRSTGKNITDQVYIYQSKVTVTTEAFPFFTSSPSLTIEVAICKITEKINKTFNSKRLCKYSVVNFIIHEFAILFSSSPYILGKEKWTKFISFEINYEIDSRGNKQTFVLLLLHATSWYFCNSKVQKSAGSLLE